MESDSQLVAHLMLENKRLVAERDEARANERRLSNAIASLEAATGTMYGTFHAAWTESNNDNHLSGDTFETVDGIVRELLARAHKVADACLPIAEEA